MSDRISRSQYNRIEGKKRGLDPLNLYLLDPSSTLFQIAISFFFSLLLAPTSAGIVYVIAFIVLWEIAVAIIYKLEVCFLARIGIVCASLLGFLIGSWLWDRTYDPIRQARNFNVPEEKERMREWIILIPWLGEFFSKEISEDLQDHTLEDSEEEEEDEAPR